MSGDEARGFWIKWGGGFIGVGKQGEGQTFLSWQDEESINVSFFGVRTGWGASGVWTVEGLFVYYIIFFIILFLNIFNNTQIAFEIFRLVNF